MRLALAALPVHVAHYTPLRERRARLQADLAAHHIVARWMTRHDREDLTAEVRARYYRRDDALWRRKTFYTECAPRALSPADLSLAIKHVEIYRQILEDGQPFALILEDDVLLAPDFAARFDRYFAHAPSDLDLVFIGSCCGLRVASATDDRHFYPKTTPATKCTDSYLISRAAAERLLRTMLPLTLPIDFELNYQLHAHGMTVYWLEPPLAAQGSQNGTYASAIRS
jgi:GR25 family glycosyltransferase involved in LPS biosynthesis